MDIDSQDDYESSLSQSYKYFHAHIISIYFLYILKKMYRILVAKFKFLKLKGENFYSKFKK